LGALAAGGAGVRLEEARQAADEGRIEDALALIGSLPPAALAPLAALLAGQCLVRRPDPLGALPYLLRAAQGAAVRGDALLSLARLRAGFGQHLLAAGHLRALLALQPDQREATFRLAQALQRAGWPDLARGALRPLEGRPGGGWWRPLARELDRELDAARAEIRAGLTAWRKGDTPDAGPLLRALLRAGRLRAASGLLARMPATPELGWLAALLAFRAGLGAPCAALRPPADAPPALRLEAAALLQALGEGGAALEALSGVPEEALGAKGRILRARLLLAAGRAAELEEAASAAFAAAPRRIDAAQALLSARLLQGKVALWRHAGPPAAPAPRLHLVQYWNAPTPPADVLAVMESWVRHHPALQLARFDDAAARAFLVARHGRAGAEAFDACHNPALRSNTLRIAFLAAHGGLWVDADERCRRPMDEVLARVPGLGLVAACSTEIPHYVHSYVLAAPPGSAVMAAMDAAQMKALRAGARGHGRIENWVTNGPGLVTRIAMAHPGKVALLEPTYWRSFAEDAADLSYKGQAGSDWRLAPRAA
jgi:hypothetical protein